MCTDFAIFSYYFEFCRICGVILYFFFFSNISNLCLFSFFLSFLFFFFWSFLLDVLSTLLMFSKNLFLCHWFFFFYYSSCLYYFLPSCFGLIWSYFSRILPVKLPLWPKYYLEMCCFISKCLEIFLLPLCYWFLLWFHCGQRTYSVSFKFF